MRRSSIAAVFVLAVLGAWIPAMPASAQVYCDGLPATIIGTPGNDVIFGTSGPDVIAGLGGDDTLFAAPESDTWYGDPFSENHVCGGSGKDFIGGAAGRDRLLGGMGRDEIDGGPGYDVLLGGPHGDRLTDDIRGSQSDVGDGTFIRGHGGPDDIECGPGLCKVVAGDGNDEIHAWAVGEGFVDAGRGVDTVDTVDINLGTEGDCTPETCSYVPDHVDGGGGTDSLLHDGDDYVNFEIVVECPFDPNDPCSG